MLVTRGSLKTGTHLISGVSQAKVRVMNDCLGKPIKVARPGAAVTISGWKSLPAAGDQVLQGSESDIKKAIVNRERKAAIDASLVDVLAINNSRREERERRELEIKLAQMGASQQPSTKTSTAGHKQLNLIIKSDVSGSAEAVENALAGIGNHLAMTNVISSTVGELAESDVMLAKTSGGEFIDHPLRRALKFHPSGSRCFFRPCATVHPTSRQRDWCQYHLVLNHLSPD